MLFDLQSGRRRTVVRIVYSLLAASFLIGFVIFGVGSSGLGGIGDLIGGGGGSGDAAASAYQAQIDQAEKQLKQDPKNEEALISLARYRYLSGTRVAELDESGTQIVPTDDTLAEWNLALDAWERYLKTDPKQQDKQTEQVAQQMVAAYQNVGDPSGAINTQKLVIEQDPTALGYGQLAYFYYADGKLDPGKAAADKAVKLAKGEEKQKLQKALDKLAEQAAAIEATSSQSETGGEKSLADPFAGLGEGTGAVPPPAP